MGENICKSITCKFSSGSAEVPVLRRVSISESGWTNDVICVGWFKDTFIPFVVLRNPSGAPTLLIFDGHGSHITMEMVELAKEHNIVLYRLPPHTTHKLQPLDVGFFNHIQREWEKQVDMVVGETGEGV